VLIDARHHRHYVTAYRRNPACRMPHHDGWRIQPLPAAADSTVHDLVALGGTLRGADAGLTVSVAGARIVTDLSCQACGARRTVFRLDRRLRATCPRCRLCGGRLSCAGFGIHDAVAVSAVPASALTTPLERFGLRAADVLTLRTPDIDAHFEMEASR
jgi:hypothetical protein